MPVIAGRSVLYGLRKSRNVTFMGVLAESQRLEVGSILSRELGPLRVRIVNFISGDSCEYCKQTNELLKELVEISNSKIVLDTYDFERDKDKALLYRVERVPATIISKDGEQATNVRYFGIPAGYEFRSLLEDIFDISQGKTRLSPPVKTKVKEIQHPVSIKVFVTPTCPYCPRAVRTAHQFAMENKNITADMIESLEFPDLSEKYSVMAVPKIIINEKVEFEGAVPENVFLWKIMEAIRVG
jgi:glutaredoxin-like protein